MNIKYLPKFIEPLIKGTKIYRPGLSNKERAKRYDRVFSLLQPIKTDIYNVIGNHEFKGLSKEESKQTKFTIYNSKKIHQPDYYYSWDTNGFHFVALNSNENYRRSIGDIFAKKAIVGSDFEFSEKQITWLIKDLSTTDKPIIISMHVPIDDIGKSSYDSVKNASIIRGMLHKSGKVVLVLQAHSHHMMAPDPSGYFKKIDNIPYVYTPSFGSSVVGPNFSEIQINRNGILIITENIQTGEIKRLFESPLDKKRVANREIKFAVINDIHYGPKRWDLYSVEHLEKYLALFVEKVNSKRYSFVINNGDWIDGHM